MIDSMSIRSIASIDGVECSAVGQCGRLVCGRWFDRRRWGVGRRLRTHSSSQQQAQTSKHRSLMMERAHHVWGHVCLNLPLPHIHRHAKPEARTPTHNKRQAPSPARSRGWRSRQRTVARKGEDPGPPPPPHPLLDWMGRRRRVVVKAAVGRQRRLRMMVMGGWRTG